MSLFAELKRRNVFRVAVFYIVTSWLLLQVTDVVVPILDLPEWVARLVLFMMALGFLPALFFAWAFELTPEGIKREKDVDRDQSVTYLTARKLDYMTIAVVILGIMVVALDRTTNPGLEDSADSPIAQQTHSDEVASASAVKADSGAEIEHDSIAVLPFVNMSADPEQTYFSDGLAESVLHRLAQIKDLRVAARTSSFRFRDHTGDVADIARQLQVANILEGSVQRAGDTIRVTAQLIDAEKGFHLWSGTYDRKLDNVFAIQDEIARSVVEALKVTLRGDAAADLSDHETDDIEAYEAYLKGREALATFSFTSLPQAEEYFKQAIAIDPDFVLAYISLGQTYIGMANTGVISRSALEDKLKPVVERIFKLDPDSGAAHAMEAWVIWGPGNDQIARSRFARAYEQAPEDSFVALQYATFLDWTDNDQEAVRIMSRSLQHDPLSADIHLRLGFAYLGLENFEKALFHAQRANVLEPQRPSAFTLQATTYTMTGQFLKALEAVEKSKELDPEDHELPANQAMLLLAMGATDAARPLVVKAMAMSPETLLPRAAEAALHYRRGDLPKAGELLLQTIRAGVEPRGWARDAVFWTLEAYALTTGHYDAILVDLANWEVDVDMNDPAIESEVDFWVKLAAVPTLRAAGKHELADEILANALAYPDRPADSDGLIAQVTQDVELTLDDLEHAYRDGPHQLWWMELQSPVLDFVRDEPRFRALLNRIEAHVAPMKKAVEAGDVER